MSFAARVVGVPTEPVGTRKNVGYACAYRIVDEIDFSTANRIFEVVI